MNAVASRLETVRVLQAPPLVAFDAGSATLETGARVLDLMPADSVVTVDPLAESIHAGHSFIRSHSRDRDCAWYSPRSGGRVVHLSSLQLAALRIIRTHPSQGAVVHPRMVLND